ncbi:unnamed protein product, partial [Candidula unifasciata]
VYVETTMNELLGWYGLPKMDNSDAHQLNIGSYPIALSQRSPSRSASATSSLTPTPTPAVAVTMQPKRCGRKFRDDNSSSIKVPNDTNNNSNSCERKPLQAKEMVTSLSKSAVSKTILPIPDSERGVAIVCSWCQQNGNKLFTLESLAGNKSFCSEVCFTQCRRASFKRNKVCEWCKHVRHTLNFVDFQDGDVQLQFCSEKCLNQYKMNIFCTEARQHLEQIQNMAGEDAKKVNGPSKGGKHEKEILITPDLWLSAHTEVDIKQEVNEDDQETVLCLRKDNTSARKNNHTEEAGATEDSETRWPEAVETRSILSDHSSCSNDDRGSQKVKSLLMSRQKKDKPNSRYINCGSKASLDSYQDKDKNRKRTPAINGDNHSQETHRNNPHGKEKDRFPDGLSQKSATFPSPITAASFNPQHMSALSMMPNWATSQLLTMMPSHLNPSFGAANISSSLGGLGYIPNTLLYSSLFSPNSLPMAVQKEAASCSMASTRADSRREVPRDKSFERERGHVRGDSTERSTRSTSSSYSSSDTPGPSSTPGATLSTGPEPVSSYVPGFSQQIHHPLQTVDLGQSLPIPHYLHDPTVAGMFPLGYNNLTPTQRNGTSVVTGLPPAAQIQHQPTSTPTATQQQLTIPPVTILVPYPVAVPIPIPVPIPLPIAPEKLFAFFREKSTQNKTETATSGSQQWLPDNRSSSPQAGRSGAPSASHSVSVSPSVSSNNSPKAVPFLCHPYGSSATISNSAEPALAIPSGRDSADSIMTLRREISGSNNKKSVVMPPCSSTLLKRTGMSPRHLTLHAPKKPRLDCPPLCSEDEAIDLSKMSSRSCSPGVSGSSSLSDTDADSSSQTSTLAVPRIHIITEHSDHPLCPSSAAVTLPSPSHQSNYSGRRSRILDAPCIPKKVRTPSPERRYVRTVPRDMVEAARRRGLRARVRTK